MNKSEKGYLSPLDTIRPVRKSDLVDLFLPKDVRQRLNMGESGIFSSMDYSLNVKINNTFDDLVQGPRFNSVSYVNSSRIEQNDSSVINNSTHKYNMRKRKRINYRNLHSGRLYVEELTRPRTINSSDSFNTSASIGERINRRYARSVPTKSRSKKKSQIVTSTPIVQRCLNAVLTSDNEINCLQISTQKLFSNFSLINKSSIDNKLQYETEMKTDLPFYTEQRTINTSTKIIDISDENVLTIDSEINDNSKKIKNETNSVITIYSENSTATDSVSDEVLVKTDIDNNYNNKSSNEQCYGISDYDSDNDSRIVLRLSDSSSDEECHDFSKDSVQLPLNKETKNHESIQYQMKSKLEKVKEIMINHNAFRLILDEKFQMLQLIHILPPDLYAELREIYYKVLNNYLYSDIDQRLLFLHIIINGDISLLNKITIPLNNIPINMQNISEQSKQLVTKSATNNITDITFTNILSPIPDNNTRRLTRSRSRSWSRKAIDKENIVSSGRRCCTKRFKKIMNKSQTTLMNNISKNCYPLDKSYVDNRRKTIKLISTRPLCKISTNIIRSLDDIHQLPSIVSFEQRLLSAKQIILNYCQQKDILKFDECYGIRQLQRFRKIGEGVYGEVYLYKKIKSPQQVIKIIPIEGNTIINGEHQKKYDEVLFEIIITSELSNLRKNNENNTSCFIELFNIHLVQGCYPNKLLQLWKDYDKQHRSDNDSPSIYKNDQQFIIFELANGGTDLEAVILDNAEQGFSLFQQLVYTLAVAENALEFEHRDMHWGNILVSSTNEPTIDFILKGKSIQVNSCGVKITLIDFTLSRILYKDSYIFNDLSNESFSSVGDYQFEIYRMMRQKNQNVWNIFVPSTNVFWLHYVLDRLTTLVKYKYKVTNKHKIFMKKLLKMHENCMLFHSVTELANSEIFLTI